MGDPSILQEELENELENGLAPNCMLLKDVIAEETAYALGP
jgi:hypothetical protein